MSEAISTPTMLRSRGSNVIHLPVREKSLDVIREAVRELWSVELLTAAAGLIVLAQAAADCGNDPDFYDRTKAAYAALERILREGGRI